MRRAYLHAAALSGDLVEASARAVARAELVWREARQHSDFAQLRRPLAMVLAFQRQIGQAKGDALGLAPYDALTRTGAERNSRSGPRPRTGDAGSGSG